MKVTTSSHQLWAIALLSISLSSKELGSLMTFVWDFGVVDTAISQMIVTTGRSGTSIGVIIPVQTYRSSLRQELAARCPLGRIRLEQVTTDDWQPLIALSGKVIFQMVMSILDQ